MRSFFLQEHYFRPDALLGEYNRQTTTHHTVLLVQRFFGTNSF
jgi:hypothetical protein